MPGIDKRTIDKVLAAAKIEEVIGDFDNIKLKKKGVRYLGYCPFHDDRHVGSFVVYPKKQCFKCFSCGAKGGVVEFLKMHEHLSFPDAIRWLGKKYNIETDMTDFNYTPPPARPAPPPLDLLVLPKYLMAGTITAQAIENDNLVRWIRTGIRWDTIQRKRVEEMLGLYCVGHGKHGHTIFWQIDEQGMLRTGKMMKYREDGHRDKDKNPTWMNYVLSRAGQFDREKCKVIRCLFGLHLAKEFADAEVCLVESEKTAVICSAFCDPNRKIWMACGGLQFFKPEMIADLVTANRYIVVYPDVDGADKWAKVIEDIGYNRMSMTAKMRPVPAGLYDPALDGPKADIADIMIRIISNPVAAEKVTDAMAETEAERIARELGAPDKAADIQYLMDKLNLVRV